MSRFRLPRAILMELCDTLREPLEAPINRCNPVPCYVQVLSTLGLLATGTFQREIGDRVGVSQPSISCAVSCILGEIIKLALQYIQFPYTPRQQIPIKTGFHSVAGLSNIIGAIDCTHVRIKAPSPDPFPYLNRKHFHSINVQIIADSRNLILSGTFPRRYPRLIYPPKFFSWNASEAWSGWRWMAYRCVKCVFSAICV